VNLHQTQDALLVDEVAVYKVQVRPDAAVSPEGVVGLKLPDALNNRFVASGDILRRFARQLRA